MQKLTIATRSSPLALWQTHWVKQRLEEIGFEIELKPIETIGDKRLDVGLSKIGDKGVFTQELEEMLRLGQAHLAVHSAKDMPSSLPDDLEILAFTEREAPHDVVVSLSPDFRLSNREVLLGTASTRRLAMLSKHFPKVKTVSIRGNLQTRFKKMKDGQCEAMILAFAGVERMGLSAYICQHLDPEIFTPAVGQGSLAIETHVNLNEEIRTRIQLALNHKETAMALETERTFLHAMQGGCSIPSFGLATWVGPDELSFCGGILSLDGNEEIKRIEKTRVKDAADCRALGEKVANLVLSEGGRSILEKIKQDLRPK